MKKFFLYSLTVLLLGVLLVNTGCKKAEEILDYVLTVIKSTGVSGEPNTGTFTYKDGQVVNYSFKTDTGYSKLNVTLNGNPVGASGTVTMTQNHTLEARGELINYSGNWKMNYTWISGNCGVTNATNESAVVTHTGDNISINIPKEGLTLTGKIKTDGSFEFSCEDTVAKDQVMKYKGSGQMTSETTFEADITAEGYYKGKKTCTSTGTVTGQKS